MLEPSRRRQVVEYLHGSYRVSERRACRVARLNRGTSRYRSHKDPRTALRMRIREISQTRVRYGYRKIRVLLNREGWKVGKEGTCMNLEDLRRKVEEGTGLKVNVQTNSKQDLTDVRAPDDLYDIWVDGKPAESAITALEAAAFLRGMLAVAKH